MSDRLYQVMAKLNQSVCNVGCVPGQTDSLIISPLLPCDGFVGEISECTYFRDGKLLEYWQLYGVGGWTKKDLRFIVDSLMGEARDFVKVMTITFEAVGFPRIKDADIQEYLLRSFLCSGLVGNLIKYMKIWVNVAFSSVCRTESPKIPDGYPGKFFVHRAVNQFVVALGRAYPKRKALVRIYSIFQGMKKGFPAIRPDAVDQSLIDHCAALTKVGETDSEILDFMERTLRSSFGDLPKEIGKGCNSTLYSQRRCPLMSVKATVEHPMGKGGQVGFARALSGHYISPDEFVGFGWIGRKHCVFPIYTSVPDDSDLREVLRRFRWDRSTDSEVLQGELESGEISPNRNVENSTVQPSVVLEPMKGRIITKPSVGAYMDMNRVQKVLWKCLKRSNPAFDLIGRPVCEEDIWHLAGSYSLGMKWNSGDFSGATDNLHRDVTRLIAKFLFSDLDPVLQVRILDSLTDSWIDYSKVPLRGGFLQDYYSVWRSCQQGLKQQTNGQLMGHVLSFPILCLANYLIFLYSFQRRGKVTPPKVRVNGDDILFCCYPEDYEAWCEDVRKIGFFPSLGKNLFSSRVAQINSVLFKIHYAERPSGWSSWGEDLFNDERISEDSFPLEFIRSWEQIPYFSDHFVRSIEVVPYLNMGIVLRRGKGKEGDLKRVNPLLDENSSVMDGIGVYRKLWSMIQSPYWSSSSLNKIFRQTYKEERGMFFRTTKMDIESYLVPPSFLERCCPLSLDPEILLLSERFSTAVYNMQAISRSNRLRAAAHSLTVSNPFGFWSLFEEDETEIGWD
jgi:hypothetical protein